jgi:hypothetical protein
MAPSEPCPQGGAGKARARTQAILVRGVVLGSLAVPVVALVWRSRGWPLVHDAPLMHYVAWRISQGAAPYRDVFDMNFPGTYLLHLAVLRVLGAGDVAWRLFDLAWLAAGAGAVAALAAPWGWLASAGGALFFALQHLAAGPWQTGQRDFLLCPFLLLGTLAVVRWQEHRRGLTTLAWGGLALGAGVTIKPHTTLLAVALASVLVVGAWRVAGWRPVVAFTIGVALPPLAVVLWVTALGAGPAWRTLVLDYLLPVYSHLGPPGWGAFYGSQAWFPVAVALGLTLVSALIHRRFTTRHRLVALGLAYGAVHYVTQGKGWEYHLYPLAAFTAVVLLAEIEPLLYAGRRLVALALVACLVVSAGGFWLKGVTAAQAAEGGWITAKERRVSALVADLGPRLRPGDLVQVLDTTEAGVHALLRLSVRQPSRFLYDFAFLHDIDRPIIQAFQAELMGALRAHPPRFIVLFRQGWPAGGYERLAAFPELAGFIADRYRIAGQSDDYRIYAKRDDP